MSDARADILKRLASAAGTSPNDRRAAVADRLRAHTRGPAVAGPDDRVQRFRDAAVRAGASVEILPSWTAVTEAAGRFLSETNLPARLRLANDPRLAALPWPATLETAVVAGAPVDDEGPALVTALAGVAETGSVVFAAKPEHPPSLNLLPETELIVLEAGTIVAAAEDVWDTLRNGPPPRSLCFVSGPSRTGDIEMNLVTGVHGPRRLHIMIVGDAG